MARKREGYEHKLISLRDEAWEVLKLIKGDRSFNETIYCMLCDHPEFSEMADMLGIELKCHEGRAVYDKPKRAAKKSRKGSRGQAV